MLLKIYLGISIITFILMVLNNFSIVNRMKNKYGKEIDAKSKETKKKDIAGIVLGWLKAVIMSFIPIYNIILLIVMLFFGNKIEEKSDEMVKSALAKENN